MQGDLRRRRAAGHQGRLYRKCGLIGKEDVISREQTLKHCLTK
jgi:hypothetical protein